MAVLIFCCVLAFTGALLSIIFIESEQTHVFHPHNHHLPLPPIIDHEKEIDIIHMQQLTNVGLDKVETAHSAKALKDATKYNLLRSEEIMSTNASTEC